MKSPKLSDRQAPGLCYLEFRTKSSVFELKNESRPSPPSCSLSRGTFLRSWVACCLCPVWTSSCRSGMMTCIWTRSGSRKCSRRCCCPAPSGPSGVTDSAFVIHLYNEQTKIRLSHTCLTHCQIYKWMWH